MLSKEVKSLNMIKYIKKSNNIESTDKYKNTSDIKYILEKMIKDKLIINQIFIFNDNKILCKNFTLNYKLSNPLTNFYIEDKLAFSLNNNCNINEIILYTLMEHKLLILNENQMFYNEVYNKFIKEEENKLLRYKKRYGLSATEENILTMIFAGVTAISILLVIWFLLILIFSIFR